MLPPGPSQALDKAAAYGIRHAHEDNGYGLGFSLQGRDDAFNRSRNHGQRVHWKPALLFNAVLQAFSIKSHAAPRVHHQHDHRFGGTGCAKAQKRPRWIGFLISVAPKPTDGVPGI